MEETVWRLRVRECFCFDLFWRKSRDFGLVADADAAKERGFGKEEEEEGKR
jgi:hypothetical protein